MHRIATLHGEPFQTKAEAIAKKLVPSTLWTLASINKSPQCWLPLSAYRKHDLPQARSAAQIEDRPNPQCFTSLTVLVT